LHLNNKKNEYQKGINSRSNQPPTLSQVLGYTNQGGHQTLNTPNRERTKLNDTKSSIAMGDLNLRQEDFLSQSREFTAGLGSDFSLQYLKSQIVPLNIKRSNKNH
jgi:hypothetical protein